MITSDTVPSQLAANSATEAYKPTSGELFASGFEGALRDSIPGQISEMASWFDQATPQKDWTPEDLAASPYAGKVKWEPGMTDHRAQLIANEHDQAQREAFVDAHWHGFTPGLIKTLGSFAGGALDPTNYIPILGEMDEAALVAKLGRTTAGAVEGATANLAIATTGQAANIITKSMLQQDPDFQGAAMNIGMAVGMGTVLGATMGRFFAHISDEALATGTAKALDDVSQGKQIDLAPVLGAEAQARAAEHQKWLGVLQDPNAPISGQERAAMELGIDPTLPPDQVAAKIAALAKEKQPDFRVAAPIESKFEMPEAAPAESLTGVNPEFEQHINGRFADLEANEGTKGFAKEANDEIEAGTRGLAERAKATLHAAMCLARVAF